MRPFLSFPSLISALKLLVLVLLTASCSLFSNDAVEEPEMDPCAWPAGNRDFTWRIDTVGYAFSNINALHVVNDSLAFVFGSVYDWYGRHSIGLRWDGKKWTSDLLEPSVNVGVYGNDATGDDSLMVVVGLFDKNDPKPAISEFNLRTRKWTKHQFTIPGELRSVWTDKKGFWVAAGDNGMVYTKDGYHADWVYSKRDDRAFYKVDGVSRTEYFANSVLAARTFSSKFWSIKNGIWSLWYETTSSSNLLRLPDSSHVIGEFNAFRCPNTDSLFLYLSSATVFKVSMKKNPDSTHVQILNESNGVRFFTGELINSITPNDVWIPDFNYALYHWNGQNVQKITSIPGLPYGEYRGVGKSVKKSKSGKIWILMETETQNYIVIQGTPLATSGN